MARPKKTKPFHPHPSAPLIAAEPDRTEEREVRLFKNGVNQALRIPKEFELPGEAAMLRKENGCLIIRPIQKNALVELLDSWGPLEEDFPEIIDLPNRPVNF